jgi:hypothetical protein
MLSECSHNKDYIAAVSTKGENYSAESVLTDYIFPLPCLIFLHKLLIFYMVIIY